VQQSALRENWAGHLAVSIVSLVLARLGFTLTGSLGIAALLFLLFAIAGFLVLRASRSWLRVLGLSIILLGVVSFVYIAAAFYLSYG
jgi:hypothetical protein